MTPTLRQRIWLGAAGLFPILLIVSPLGARLGLWGLTVPLPSDPGQEVDAIVVLGRGPEFRADRIAVAQNLWQANRAPRLFVSGMLDAYPIAKNLKEKGILTPKLSWEECSQSTVENAQFTHAILWHQGVRTILLVTDAPHMLRSHLSFREVGFHVVPHPIPLPAAVDRASQWPTVLREYTGLMQYALSNQFNRSFQTRAPLAESEVVYRIREWKCLNKTSQNGVKDKMPTWVTLGSRPNPSLD